MKLATWALAAALLVPSLAAADRGAPDARTERRARMLERFDANHDGRLDRAERRQAKATIRARRAAKREARIQRFIQRYDTNHDGNVGPGEVPPEAMRRLKRLDRNGDGWVQPHERRPRDAAPAAPGFDADPQ